MPAPGPVAIGVIRRYYETRKTPIVPTERARRDVLALLDDRKAIQRAAEALMDTALPYGGDANVKRAIDGLRAVLEGRAPAQV
jgi:hypothetical protein